MTIILDTRTRITDETIEITIKIGGYIEDNLINEIAFVDIDLDIITDIIIKKIKKKAFE